MAPAVPAPAAPAPAAPPAPAPPAPSANYAKPAIRPEDLDQYQSLRGNIGKLEAAQVEAAAATAHARLQQATAERAAQTRRVAGATEAKGKAEKVAEEKDDWYPGKLLGGEAKREAKKEEKEKALAAATAGVDAEAQRLAALEAAVKAAHGEAGEAAGKVQELGASRAGLSSLLERVFADPGWAADPTLSSLRAAVGQLNAQGTEAAAHAATYSQGRDRLKASKTKIDQALGMLRRTKFMGAMEVGMQIGGPPRRRQPGGMMVDMAQMAMVRQANDLVKSAAGDIQAAKTILPALPNQQTEGATQAAAAGVFMNVLAPGLIGDMAQQAAIRKSIATVEQLRGGVMHCLEWTQRNLDAFSLDVNRAQAAVAERHAEMVRYQHSIMGEAVAKAGK